MSDANEKNNDLDDLFFQMEKDDANEESSRVGTSEADEFNPFGTSGVDDLNSDASNAFASTSGETDDPLSTIDRKDQKENEPSLSRQKKRAKSKKEDERVEEKKENRVLYGSALPIWLLEIVFLSIVVLGNVAAFVHSGGSIAADLAFVDVFGLVLISIPLYLHWIRKERPVSLFDALLALAAAFVTLGVMFLGSYWAKNYEGKIKSASAAPAIVRVDDRV